MTIAEYLESQRGKPYSQIVAEQPMETVIGSIRGDNLRDVVAILAAGLQYRLENAAPSPARTALLTAFNYLTLPEYAINLTLPENVGLLAQAVADGLVTQDESDKFFALASYQRPLLNVTRQHCADYFGPDWSVIDTTSDENFVLRLTDATPEQTYVVVQAQDTYPDGTLSDWYHATSLHGIGVAREYTARLPYNGRPRKLRWKCEYSASMVAGTR